MCYNININLKIGMNCRKNVQFEQEHRLTAKTVTIKFKHGTYTFLRNLHFKLYTNLSIGKAIEN